MARAEGTVIFGAVLLNGWQLFSTTLLGMDLFIHRFSQIITDFFLMILKNHFQARLMEKISENQ